MTYPGSSFPAGGAIFVSPADQGTSSYRMSAERESDHQPMDDDEVQSALHLMVSDAIQYVDQELSPARGLAADYYQGKPFGNEEDGRSQVVLTILRDTVRTVLPSLMTVFFGNGEKAVEYAPRRADQVEQAEQATIYVNEIVINQDNEGFLTFLHWFKDALIKKLGIVKWWYDESEETETHTATMLEPAQVAMLEDHPDVKVTKITHSPGLPPGLAYDVTYVRTRTTGKIRFTCIPPEEWLFTRGARTTRADAAMPGVALFVGHRTELTKSQLLSLGISEDDIDEYAFKDASLDHNVEEISRQAIVKPDVGQTGPIATRKALYIEGFPYLDADGDGIAELRRVCMLGPSYHVISNEPWAERQFAVLCPDPEPHTIIGQSLADYTMDLQKIMSMIARSMNDSLALSIHPRVAYQEGMVSVEDVMNTEIGAPIRTRESPATVLQTFEHQFKGQDAMPVLEYYEGVRQSRTGALRPGAFLDADAMQSTTKTAVSATVSDAQKHIEMIARIFAETGVKQLMNGLLREVVAHPDQARMVRVRGKYVAMDPRQWNAELDLRVNVALGGGLDDQKIAVLMGIIEKQELYLQLLGPSNPLVSLTNLRYALGKVLQLKGRQDVDNFFGDVPEGYSPPPPQPSAEQAKAQSEMMRAQAEVQKKQAEIQHLEQKIALVGANHAAQHQLKSQEMALEDQRERERLEAELVLKNKELEMDHEQAITIAGINARAKVQSGGDGKSGGGVGLHLPGLEDAVQTHLHHLTTEHQDKMKDLSGAVTDLKEGLGHLTALVKKPKGKVHAKKHADGEWTIEVKE